MEEQNNLQQNGETPDSRQNQTSEPNSQPQHVKDDIYSSNPQPQKKSKKLALLVILLVILLLGTVAGAWYFMTKEDKPVEQISAQETEQAEQEEVSKETASEPMLYISKLYPDFSFTVPEGWEVAEPEEYEEGEWGPGHTYGVITVSKGDVKLNLEMLTIYATGFEGTSCYKVANLATVGDYYRYTDSEGVTVYRNGLTEKDDEWAFTISDTEYTILEDADPNYCVSFPYIGTYSSTINQADYDLPYGYNEFEKVLVWLDATVSGPASDNDLAEIDSMILSKSASVISD